MLKTNGGESTLDVFETRHSDTWYYNIISNILYSYYVYNLVV